MKKVKLSEQWKRNLQTAYLVFMGLLVAAFLCLILLFIGCAIEEPSASGSTVYIVTDSGHISANTTTDFTGLLIGDGSNVGVIADVGGLSGLLADDQHVIDAEVITAIEAEVGLTLAGNLDLDSNELLLAMITSPVVKGSWTREGVWSIPGFSVIGDIDTNAHKIIFDVDEDTYFDNDSDDELLFIIGGYTAFEYVPSGFKGYRYNNNQTGSQSFIYRRARGTQAVPLAISNDDWAGYIYWQGWDGNSWEPIALITSEVDGVVSDEDMPGRMIFMVTPDGTGAYAEAMRISNTLEVSFKGSLLLDEIAAPANPATNEARIYAVEGGDTLTDVAVKFQDGTVDIFAQESTPLDSPLFRYGDNTQIQMVMRKPNPAIIQFVVVFPDGSEYVIKEINYHNQDKINASNGAATPLPKNWKIEEKWEREIEIREPMFDE